MKRLPILFLIIVFFSNCEEVIDLDIPNTNSRIVVDGLITDQNGPYTVTLSKSSKYSFVYQVNPDTYTQHALIIIKDDIGNIDTLDEISPGIYQTDSNKIKGEVGRSYAIEIQTHKDGNWASNFEKMIQVPKIDSLYYERDKHDISSENLYHYKFKIYVDWHDPINENNYYLRNISYYWSDTWHNNINWNWVFSDKYFNGDTIKKSLLQEDYGGKFFSVRLKQYSLTREAYRFWNLVHEQTQLTDNSITNSSVPLYGNIQNIDNPDEYALGYFQVSAVSEAIVEINE